MDKYLEFNTDGFSEIVGGTSPYENRTLVAQMLQEEGKPEVTIIVQGYNRVEKTKECVDSILKYTQDVDYELLLIDNGSTDDTLEYFKSVEHAHKTVMRLTKNTGAFVPSFYIAPALFSKYICIVANDLIVTKNWLSNMLICIKSDPTIGMVNPMSSNTSNLQSMNCECDTIEEMQKKAAEFNVSDPSKWEERLRLITLGTLYRKEAIFAIGWPISDVGFAHDFADDDTTFRIRRAGYKTVLAGDTWIHHNHDLKRMEGKDPAKFRESIKCGRMNFRDKYYGVDAWDDVNNYIQGDISALPVGTTDEPVNVLGIDTKCGTEILDVKHILKKQGVTKFSLSAYTEDARYWLDLKTICNGTVHCDRAMFLREHFASGSQRVIVIGKAVNLYPEPEKLIFDAFSLLKSKGTLILRLRNTHNLQDYLYSMGENDMYDKEYAKNITLDGLLKMITPIATVYGGQVFSSALSVEDGSEFVKSILPEQIGAAKKEEIGNRLLTKEYLIVLQKR